MEAPTLPDGVSLTLGVFGVIVGIIGLSPLTAYIRSQFPGWWRQNRFETELQSEVAGIREIVDSIKSTMTSNQSPSEAIASGIASGIERIEEINRHFEALLRGFIRDVKDNLNARVRQEVLNEVHIIMDEVAPETNPPPS